MASFAASTSVSGSTFTGNTAGGDGGAGSLSGRGEGGAIKGDSGTGPLTINESTFSDNATGGKEGGGGGSGGASGGAINSFSALTITDSTFSDNTAGGQDGGGGAFGQGDGTATLSGEPAVSAGGSHSIAIKASNGTPPDATQSFTLTVQAPPTVSIVVPTPSATYTQGQIVHSSFTCAEGAAGPGIASCTTQSGRRSGAAIGTAKPVGTSSP